MFTYIIRCKDNSLYCGYTTDIYRRIDEHKNSIGSKYVKAKKFMKLELVISLNTKSDAMKMEFFIKNLSKKNKESLILGNFSLLDKSEIKYKIYFY